LIENSFGTGSAFAHFEEGLNENGVYYPNVFL